MDFDNATVFEVEHQRLDTSNRSIQGRESGIGSISKIFDAEDPHAPVNGSAQA